MIAASAHDAYDPSSHTYWALADFSASDSAMAAHDHFVGTPNDPLIQFQDGPFVFARTDGSGWSLVTATGGLICPPHPPAPVLALWRVGGGSDCHG